MRSPDLSLDGLRAARLPHEWYARGAVDGARRLIGCLLVHEARNGEPPRVSRIVETEAYCGARDLACHARAGLTNRTRTLLGDEGHAYVFFIYGMHFCFNVTCGSAGRGHAVLIRAGEPTHGFELGVRLDGPGRFARAMGITRAFDGHDLTAPPLYLCPRPRKRVRLIATERVGVAYAGEWAHRPWRFLDAGSGHVSKGRSPGYCDPRLNIGAGRVAPNG